MMKHDLKMTLAICTVVASINTVWSSSVFAHSSCSTKSFNWAREWDDEFTDTKYRALQFPATSTCISGKDLNDRKVDGHFFQQDGHAVFDNDLGDDGRTEIRSQNMSGSHSQFKARFRFEQSSLGSRQYTVGQMFGEGDGPIVRIEQNFGELRAVIRTKPGAKTKTYGSRGVKLDTWYTYRMVRKNDNIKVWIGSNEVTPSGGLNLSGFPKDKTYYKAGCYMNNSTIDSGCRAKFDYIDYNR